MAALACQPAESGSERSSVPSWGRASTLEVASWNVNWFGSSNQGPKNERAQRRRVREVLQGGDLDLWALTEVVDASAFAALLDELPGYSGLLASDARVRDGSRFYAAAEQKPAVVFKRAALQLVEAELILVEREAEFAGRPPLRVALRAAAELMQVVVLHAKAYSDTKSYARRAAASAALQAYLDHTFPTAKLLVVGDFNDEISRSISAGRPSPYANFLAAGSQYRFLTAELSAQQLTSTVNHAGMIDHHLVSDELLAHFVAGSTQVLPVDRYISDYAETTSDHYPVLSRFEWP